MSVDGLNLGRLSLVVMCPLTRTDRPSPLHVAIDPPEANLGHRTFVLVEHVRSVSAERLGTRIGKVSPGTSARIDARLRLLFDL